MPISPARRAAFDILCRVEREGAFASELLHSKQYDDLSTLDHGLATELVMGVLRWRSWLDGVVSAHSSHPLTKIDLPVLTALRLAVFQLQFLDRVPPRAAVHESVELTKRARKNSAAPFVNAILRKITPTSEKKPLEQASTALEAADLAGATAHPLWMVDRWEREFGEENVRKICAHDQRAPEISVRVASPDTEKELRREGVELVPGRILTSARTAVSGNITHTSAFRQGRVVVQDEASQLIALLVGCGTNILDCCSAPGGKTRIVARRNPQARILAVELHPHRARTMRRLIPEKNVEVVAGDVTAFAAVERFDHILADVPCSGTGTLSRNPEIKWKLKPSDLADLHRKQTAILEAAMKVLLPGGKLIYSTCSLEREENEDVIEEVVRLNPNLRIVDCDSELQKLRQEGETAWPDLHSLTGGRFLRTIPGVHPCDGFFAAILQKD